MTKKVAAPIKTLPKRRRAAYFIIAILGASVVISALSLGRGLFSSDEEVPAQFLVGFEYPPTGEEMTLRINLESETYGARTVIPTKVWLFPDHEFRKQNNMPYDDLPPTLYMIFLGSGCEEVKESPYGQINACTIQLTKESTIANPNAYNYAGTGEIRYAFGGQFGIMISEFDISQVEPNWEVVGLDGVVQIEPSSTTFDRQYFLGGLVVAIILQSIGIIVSAISLLRQQAQ